MAQKEAKQDGQFDQMDMAIADLKANAGKWAKTPNDQRVAILGQIKDELMKVAEKWATEAAQRKQIPADSPLVGEEWISGPYTLMGACNHLMQTISQMDGKSFLKSIPLRKTVTGKTSAKIVPHSLWDFLLLSGVRADVWMKQGVDASNLAQHTAGAYDIPLDKREAKVSLVLGAGNIAAIAPLDCFQKLFSEHQTVLLKMNPVNDYLIEFLEPALKPLIDLGALRIVKGDAVVGEYLCNHPDVDEIHITGSGASHDAIVWGVGKEGEANKKAGTPRNKRPISSELGAVCPTIIVPGSWTSADLSFQAAQVATQKLHNSGFNCVACQVLILPDGWDKTDTFMEKLELAMKNAPSRGLYYPGAGERMNDFSDHGDNVLKFERPGSDACIVSSISNGTKDWAEHNEVFAPAMNTYRISENDPAEYLKQAITYSNENLHGTLGANILIHPSTISKIGEDEFEAIIADLHYGTIAINAWTGLGFLMAPCPWGAYPGHTLDDVQSGIGFVHNTYMFDSVERCVVWAPFRPFPRNLLSFNFTLLPKPPWFINNSKQHKIGMLLTKFNYKPSILKIPLIFLYALLG